VKRARDLVPSAPVIRSRSRSLLLSCLLVLCAAGLGPGCARFRGSPDVAARPERFRIAGLEEHAVRDAFDAFQRAVRSEDREAIADLVALPLRVGGRRVRTRDELLREHGSIWTPAVQRIVLAQRFDELFVNAQGVMFGNGVVWMAGVCTAGSSPGACSDPRVRVIAVNPGSAR
jgi:hypothetical protein